MAEHPLLASLLSFATRRPRIVLAASAALGLLSLLVVRGIRLEGDVLMLLPQKGEAVRSLSTFVQNFGSLDHLYVVFRAPRGQVASDYDDLIEAYVTELRLAPEVEGVDSAPIDAGKDWSYLLDHTIRLVGPEALPEALARLEPAGMAMALARTSEALTVPSRGVKSLVQEDPLGLGGLLRERFVGATGTPAAVEGGYIAPDGLSRLVIVKPKRPPFDVDFCRALLTRLAAIEGSVTPRFVTATLPQPEIEIVGAYRVSVEAEEQIHREMKTNAIGSLIGILLLVFLVYRTPWIVLCVGWTLGLSALYTLALMGLSGMPLLAAATGGAAILFGLGEDGILLLHARYLEEKSVGRTGPAAIGAVAATASSMMLGNLTSVATFGALLLLDFPSLEQLGLVVALGMILSSLLTLLFVPVFLFPQAAATRRRAPRIRAAWLGNLVARRRGAILAAAAVFTVTLGLAASDLEVTTSLERLKPVTPGMVAEHELRESFGLHGDDLIALFEGPDLEPLLEQNERWTEAMSPLADSVTIRSPSDLLPSERAQANAAAAIVAAGLAPEVVTARLVEAASRAGFRDGAFAHFIARLPALVDPEARLTYDGFVAHGLGDLISRHVARRDGGFVTAAYLRPSPGADLDRVVRAAAAAEPNVRITGIPLVDQELATNFLPSLAKGLGLGAAAVAVILWWGFRRLDLMLMALFPTVLALLWTAGALALLGVDVDLFSAFALVMVIGVGVDYGIHIVHRYAIERAPDMTEVLARTGGAVLIAGLTTVIGFGTLVTSSYPPLRSLGIVSALSISFCLITSLMVLPALIGSRRRG